MKNKIIAAVVPVAAFAALAGTGFGSWYFAQGGASAEATASVAVTSAVEETGSITLSNSKLYLVLDQTDAPYWSTTGKDDKNDAVTSVTATYTLGDHTSASNMDTTVITMNAAWTTTDNNSADGYSAYVDIASKNVTKAVMSWNGGTGTYTYSLPTVTWNDGKKPQTKSAYDEMVKAMANISFSLNFSTDVAA